MDEDYCRETNRLERERIRKEVDRVRNFSGANFSKHFNLRREAAQAPAPPEIPIPNPHRIWEDFSVKPILFQTENPSYSQREVMKVKILLDPSTLTYPIDFLKFCAADKSLEYDALSMEINEVYKNVTQVTSKHTLTNHYIMKGNVAIIMEHDVYKRAQLLETLKPNDEYRGVFCYLLDEGIEIMVHESRIFRAIKDFWTLPPRIMKFRLAGLRRYENTTEFRQLLIKEFALKPEIEDELDLSAEIVSKKLDGYKIVLTSSKYPNRSINEIILRSLFTCFDMKTILSSTNFYPAAKLVGARKNGNILLQLDTPVLRHLRELMTKNQHDRFTAGQKKTDGSVKKDECYIYLNPDKETCFRVRCIEESHSKEVNVLFMDHGTIHKVNKMRLAHVKHFGSNKLPFNVLAIISPQSVLAHLAGIESMNLTDFYKLFDRQDSFYLRKTQKLGIKSSASALAEVELFPDCLKNVPLGKQTSLNKLVFEISPGTMDQLVSKNEPSTYCIRDFSSFAPVNPEGANWGPLNGNFVPLEVGETLEIIVVGDGERGELFVRSAHAYSTGLMNTIHKECQSYLAEFTRDDPLVLCKCIADGFHFVVETQFEFECTRFHRIRVLDRTLQPIGQVKGIIKYPQWNIKPIECRPKNVECLFIDRGEYRPVPVADLQMMNPAVAVYPAQGALAIWTCDEHDWGYHDWNRFVKYAINGRFKAKVLTLSQDSFGRFRFDINLYKIGGTDTDNGLLRPKDRFWETRWSSPKFNIRSRHTNNKEKKEPIYYEHKQFHPPSLFDN